MTPEPTGKHLPHIPPWAIAVAAALLFGVLDVAGSLAAGPGRTPLHNPIGLLALALTGGFQEGLTAQRLPLIFNLFVAGSAAVCILCAVLAGLACSAISLHRRMLFIGAQVACALVDDSLPFHMIAAIQMGMLLPWRHALALLLMQFLAGFATDALLVLDLSVRQHQPPRWPMLAYFAAERTIFVAGFVAARLVLREHRTRQSLATAHAQILATQSLLTQTVRGAERLRIARDLHDAIGHHLTALNLHLDLAMRQARKEHERAPPSLVTARDVSAQLLAQVRGVVSASRQDQDIDLADAIHKLCEGIPGLDIDVRIDPGATRHPAQVAHALFCCIQEAVTNALRHAHGRRLSIDLHTHDGVTIARIADDGRGKPGAAEGNGLRGMRERLDDLGGELRYNHPAAGGFALEMRVPQQWASA